MFNTIATVLFCLAIASLIAAIILSIFIKIVDSKLEPIRKEIKEREKLREESKTFEVSFSKSIHFKGQKGGFKKKRFDSIDDFGRWIIEQNNDNVVLKQNNLVKLDGDKLSVLVCGGEKPVSSIKDHRGYLYSDGDKTSKVKHCSKEIKSWVESFNQYYEDLKAANLACNFVE